MCFSRAGARTAERRGPGEAGAEQQVVLAPSHWLFRKQRKKMEAGAEPGKARRGRVPVSLGMGEEVAKGTQARGASEVCNRKRRRREGLRSEPRGSQSQQKARRCGYLCSERPRGSRALQQLHLALLSHRRYGRRLGRVALDHRRKVGS